MQTRSGTARAGDVEIFYEDLGDLDAPPVLLIMGVGAQLPMWPDGFCDQLVDKGYRVIRFDHRDTGLSTKLHGAESRRLGVPAGAPLRDGPPQPGALHARRHGRRREGPAGPPRHRARPRRRRIDGRDDRPGAGGQPSRTPGFTGTDHVELQPAALGGAALAGDQAGVRRPREGRAMGGPAGRRGPQASRSSTAPTTYRRSMQLRRRVEHLRARSDYPQGMLRQFDAILGTGSLLRYTRRITAPTVVVHGTDDPMVRPRNGRNLARGHSGRAVRRRRRHGPRPTRSRCGAPLSRRSPRTSGWQAASLAPAKRNSSRESEKWPAGMQFRR